MPNFYRFNSVSFHSFPNGLMRESQLFSGLSDGEKVLNWLASGHLSGKGITEDGTGQENCGMSPTEATQGGQHNDRPITGSGYYNHYSFAEGARCDILLRGGDGEPLPQTS